MWFDVWCTSFRYLLALISVSCAVLFYNLRSVVLCIIR